MGNGGMRLRRHYFSFVEWMDDVDLCLYFKAGVTTHDVDYRFGDDFNDGLSAVKSANRALRTYRKKEYVG